MRLASALLLALLLTEPSLAGQPQLAQSEKGAWLGLMHMRSLTRESASARGFDGAGGVLVYFVFPGGPAERAGIRVDDILVELDGRKTMSAEILVAILRSRRAGATVEAKVFRDRRLQRLAVTLGDRSEKPWEGMPSDETLKAEYDQALEVYNSGDKARALGLFRSLADRGYHFPCYNLGYMYEHGEGGVFKDLRLAARWYRLCGELRTTLGAYELGRLYQRGAGVERDDVRAYYWFSVAAEVDDGDQRAIEARDEMARKLTLTQLEEAERLAAVLPVEGDPAARTAAPKAQAPVQKSVPQADPAVREVQELLARLGYRPGPADGLMGRRTRSAIRLFQKDRGLPEDGMAGPDILFRLRGAVAEAPPAQTARPATESQAEDLGDLDDLSDF